mmetsp:Transcript_52280/g.111818  ORF Transcript_52280/g.111818 Transcript_52280/m.111818 type:complete len:313 (+) Transcript_52280:158-1096(+)
MLRTYSFESSEMWQKPSVPGCSDTKIPKGTIFLISQPRYAAPTSMGGGGGADGAKGEDLGPRGSSSMRLRMRSAASWTAASLVPVMQTEPGPDLSIAIESTPDSEVIELMVAPPAPMILPTMLGGMLIERMRGTPSGSAAGPSGSASSMSPRMWRRPCRACSRACRISGSERPSHLMSSWKAEMPASSPATLKSMVPSASSEPRMSVRMMGSPPPPVSSRSKPMATPATLRESGTPAVSIARQPEQTEAIEEEPQLSVMRDSTRTVYWKSSSDGIDGRSARSARLPCPTSRRPGAPMRPTSPTEKGGKEYCR